MSREYVGACIKCECALYHDNDNPHDQNISNVGDYDFICYPCQFKLMDRDLWIEIRNEALANAPRS